MHTFKVISLIVVLLSIIIVSGISTLKSLESTSKKLENQIIAIENNAKSGNWEKAESGLAAVKKDWKDTSKTWASLIDHLEIDNIEISFSKIGKYIAVKDTSMALAEAATLSQYIKHIPEKESFNLKNIL